MPEYDTNITEQDIEEMEPRREIPNDSLDFEGLLYRRRYFVEDAMGARLENDQIRASAEAGVEQEISHAGPVGTFPRVAIEPAGNNVIAVVELGSSTLDDINKIELDHALDRAMEGEVGANKEMAEEVFPDETDWEVRCR